MSDSPHIVSVGRADFLREVVEKSREIPVLVDFWAVWCAPCQMLNPVLVKLADEFQGKLRIAKVDIDEQQELALQYGVRSVPTLKLFHGGQVVRELLGAQPENVLRQAIEPYIARPVDALRAQAGLAKTAGHTAEAERLLRQAVADDPAYYRSHQDLLALLLEDGQFGAAQELFNSLPANIQADPAVNAVLPRLEFGRVVQQAPKPEALEQTLATNPDDHQARLQLSAHQVLAGHYQAAMDNLLAILRKDRSFGDDAARKSLVSIFTLLGDDPLVTRYRAKLSSLLY